MTNYLTDLFNRKDQLMQHIRSLDELIKHELQEGVSSRPAETDSVPAPAAPAGNPAYDRLSWRKKILHHLGKAEGDGMTTSELNGALKAAHHGEWPKPSIATTLFLMERDGLIRMDRSKGRNRHFLPGQEAAAASGADSEKAAQ